MKKRSIQGVCEHFEEARCKSRYAGQHCNWALDVFLRWLVTFDTMVQSVIELSYIVSIHEV